MSHYVASYSENSLKLLNDHASKGYIDARIVNDVNRVFS